MNTKPITMRIPKDLLEEIREFCREDDRTFTSFAVRSMREALKAVKQKKEDDR